jgi:hypothetical protein
MNFDPASLTELAKSLIDQGTARGVTLRLMGHLAVREHVQENMGLLDLLKRVPTHDIDFMGYSRDQEEADRMFKELGYQADPSVAFSQEYGIQRLIYHQRENGIMAEIFLDQLRMAHSLDFRGRLELDSPTISLVDLLLSKLQIQDISEKDIQDMIVLLAEHELGSGDREQIDLGYMLKLTRDDWGLYHTASKNLSMVRSMVGQYEAIELPTRGIVDAKVEEIKARMEEVPKTIHWKLRARIGTRVKWYQEVGDVENIYR